MKRSSFIKSLFSLIAAPSIVSFFTGCKNNEEKPVITGPARVKERLDAYKVKKFSVPVIKIPVHEKDTSTHPGFDYYEIAATQQDHDFGLRDVNGNEFIDPSTGTAIKTTTWGYGGIHLGKTIEARTGQPVRIKYTNDLREANGSVLKKHIFPVDPTLCGTDKNEPEIRIVPHLHGGHVESASDGHPEKWFTNDSNKPANGLGGPAGNSVTYVYDNDQDACTLWYHDHALGITRLNVYAGLAAFYIIRDNFEDTLNLPSGDYEIALAIQDKSFYDDGSLLFSTKTIKDKNGLEVPSIESEFFGDMIVVNGKVWPYLEVEPRKYRFRILNACQDRYLNLWLDNGTSMTQIGTEGGFLPSSVVIGDSASNALLMGNAERADIIIDFSNLGGQTITLMNDAKIPHPNGSSITDTPTGQIMQFRVSKNLMGSDTSVVPSTLKTITPLVAVKTRYLALTSTTDEYGRRKTLLNDLKFHDTITEKPKNGTIEEWVLINMTTKTHPIHLHLVFFQVIEKGEAGNFKSFDLLSGTEPSADLIPDASLIHENEKGWKDTVNVPRIGYVKIRAKFDRIGEYMWHCHMLSHEEHEMMRPFEVIA